MPRKPRRRLWKIVRAVLLIAAAGILGVAALVFAWTRELPAFDTLKDYQPLVSTRVYAADGTEAFQFFSERRTVVPIQDIPEVLKKAVLAAEDARFYEHEGVNYLAIVRCAGRGVLHGGMRCGGSTITQQVVKTFLLSSEWRVKRKVKELVLAPRLEQNLSKDEILYLYLNQIYFGHLRYGVQEASRFYFGKDVKDLGLAEAATLAGIIASPMNKSPVNHPGAAKERQQYVLRRMRKEGWITEAQLKAEIDRPLLTRPPPPEPPGAWYADAVRKVLEEKYGVERVATDGLVVEIAMDPRLQQYAELALQAGLRAVDRRQGWRGPILHLEPAQLEGALPVWREKLGSVDPRPGQVMVWDLGKVDPELLAPGEEAPERDVARMARARVLATGDVYAGLVVKVEEKTAVVDLGNARGELKLADVTWARKWNPSEATAAPKKMSSVVRAGDVVQVQVLLGKVPPERAAREKKLLSLSLEQTPLVQGALVAIDPATRGVRALVGGIGYGSRNLFNRALQARRQAGSAMKPFVWGSAVESRRYTPGTIVYDTPDLYRDPWGKEWKPRNYERDSFDGPMLLGAALAHSKNTVAVKLVNALGVDAVVDFSRRLGIESELPRNLTLALGTGDVTPLELTNAYTSIAAHGFATPPVLILSVKDRHGNLLEEHPPVEPPRVMPVVAPDALDGAAFAGDTPPPTTAQPPPDSADPSLAAPFFAIPETGTRPDVAYLLTSMLREVIDSGTAAAAKTLQRPAAGKTGTTQEHRNAWFVGFTPELAAGVWVGFDDNAPLGPRETGAMAALPAWISFMQAALGGKPASQFDLVPGVEQVRIDVATGKLAGPDQPNAPFLPFISGTAPTESGGSDTKPPENFFMDDR